MIRRTQVRSLAKINLDLRVLHKRPDGFHELRTVFQTISLADTIGIEFEPAKKTRLEIDDPLKIADNLVLKAANLALDAMKVRARIRFTLSKSIPMGGGLGGGSSNAAAVLLALPVLVGKVIPMEKLLELGSQLGSDVPFFLTGGTAVAIDRGTESYPLPEIAEEPILLVASGIHVATGAAYQALGRPGAGLTSPDLSRKINDFQHFARTLGDVRSAKAASEFSANDFEPVVFGLNPQLKTLWAKLRRVAGGSARMTGSGSALFALFRLEAERDLALQVLERDRMFENCRVIPAGLVSRKRYQRLWRRQLQEHLDAQELWPPRSRYVR